MLALPGALIAASKTEHTREHPNAMLTGLTGQKRFRWNDKWGFNCATINPDRRQTLLICSGRALVHTGSVRCSAVARSAGFPPPLPTPFSPTQGTLITAGNGNGWRTNDIWTGWWLPAADTPGHSLSICCRVDVMGFHFSSRLCHVLFLPFSPFRCIRVPFLGAPSCSCPGWVRVQPSNTPASGVNIFAGRVFFFVRNWLEI